MENSYCVSHAHLNHTLAIQTVQNIFDILVSAIFAGFTINTARTLNTTSFVLNKAIRKSGGKAAGETLRPPFILFIAFVFALLVRRRRVGY